MANTESDVPTTEWLIKKLRKLLDGAAGEAETDHGACAKYAELIFKMLPHRSREGDGTAEVSELERVRQEIEREGAEP